MSTAISSSVPETDAGAVLDSLRARMAKLGVALTPMTSARKAVIGGSMRKAFGLEPEDLRYALTVAAKLAHSGELARAFEIYVTLIVCDPMNVAFQTGLGACALKLGEYELALRAGAAVIALAPTDAGGHYISGRANLSLRRRDDAMTDLRAALGCAEKTGNPGLATEIGALLRKVEALAAR